MAIQEHVPKHSVLQDDMGRAVRRSVQPVLPDHVRAHTDEQTRFEKSVQDSLGHRPSLRSMHGNIGCMMQGCVLQEAMEVFLYYVYKDELDTRLDAELAAAVLHIAQYYGAPRLAGLCERLLAREIKNGDPEDEGNNPFSHVTVCCHLSYFVHFVQVQSHVLPSSASEISKAQESTTFVVSVYHHSRGYSVGKSSDSI